MWSVLDDHVSAADITDLIRNLILNINLLKLFLCCVYIFLKIRVEVSDNCLPLNSSCLHTVQKSFHHRCEAHIYNARKSLLHNVVYHFSKFCNIKVLLFFGNITSADDCCDRRRISTWTADSLFFQCLYKRSLCVMCRRLCKMLFRLQFFQSKFHALFQRLAQNIAFLIIFLLCIYR